MCSTVPHAVALTELSVLFSLERVMNCQRPTLEAGFLHPDLDVYPHSWRIFYGCNQGLKPAFMAWWGETWCDDGTWSHTPQCIGKF